MPELADPVQTEPHSHRNSGRLGAAGSVMRVPSVQPYWTGDTAKQDTLDYATAPAKFEGGEFRGLIFCLLRDNSKSGCSLFSESLAEKCFATIIVALVWGYSSVGRASRSQGVFD